MWDFFSPAQASAPVGPVSAGSRLANAGVLFAERVATGQPIATVGVQAKADVGPVLGAAIAFGSLAVIVLAVSLIRR